MTHCSECGKELALSLDKCPDRGTPIDTGDILVWAAESEDVVRIREIIEAGADVDTANSSSETALLKASQLGVAEAVKVLLENGHSQFHWRRFSHSLKYLDNNCSLHYSITSTVTCLSLPSDQDNGREARIRTLG